jgi:hypothetical protein
MTALPALTIERTDLALPAEDIEAAAAFARNEKAPATRAAYRSDFALFRAWCAGKGVSAVMPIFTGWWRLAADPVARRPGSRAAGRFCGHRCLPGGSGLAVGGGARTQAAGVGRGCAFSCLRLAKGACNAPVASLTTGEKLRRLTKGGTPGRLAIPPDEPTTALYPNLKSENVIIYIHGPQGKGTAAADRRCTRAPLVGRRRSDRRQPRRGPLDAESWAPEQPLIAAAQCLDPLRRPWVFGPARCLRPPGAVATRGRLARFAGRFAGSAPLLLTPKLTPARITAQ